MTGLKQYRKGLTIAGSDSGGGAGIQADLKTFSALGIYGMSAITAITAQNTKGVTGIHPVPAGMIEKQLQAVLSDIGTDAVKIGMMHNSETIETIVSVLSEYNTGNIVVDPVMTAASGDKLLREEAISTLVEKLLPAASIITPNLYEAEIILKRKIKNRKEFTKAAKDLADTGAKAILLKAGHFEEGGVLTDTLFIASTGELYEFSNPKIETINTHGTGCTLSSAIAAGLAMEQTIKKAVEEGIDYTHKAIATGAEYKTGKGHGPVNHFHSRQK